MYNITIEKDSSYAGYDDIFIVSQEESFVSITHEAEGFMNKDTKSQTIEISNKDFQPIAETFEKIDFYKVLAESDVLKGYDGWILKCTISKGMTDLTVSLWCPNEDPSKPETAKLIKACNRIIDLFPKEKEDADS